MCNKSLFSVLRFIKSFILFFIAEAKTPIKYATKKKKK